MKGKVSVNAVIRLIDGAAPGQATVVSDLVQRLSEALPRVRKTGEIVVLAQSDAPRRAMLFDLDATLTTCEFLDVLAESVGLGDRIRGLTRAAMEGRMDFAASYRERVALFAGTPVERVEALIAQLPLAEGAAELFEQLRRRDIRTAIVTGGYARVGRAIQQRLGADALYATELEERGGRLTGRLAGPLLDAAAKVAALDDFCAENGLQRCECVAVGDGANDLPMLAAAGWGVLYTARPEDPGAARPISCLLDW